MTCCTTLNRIRVHGPYDSGWKKLLRHLGKTTADDELLPFAVIVEANGLDNALRCCCSVNYDRVWRLYAVWCARQVQHLMKDQRSLDALDVAQAYAVGMATRDQLGRAWAAARDAAWAAARDAARDAARVAAWDAAWAAAWDAARDAARVATRDQLGRAWAAARDAARDAAWDAARDAQKSMFLRVVNAPSEQAAVDLLLVELPLTKEMK